MVDKRLTLFKKKNAKQFSQVSIQFYTPTGNVLDLFVPHPNQHLVLPIIFILVILVGMGIYFTWHRVQ